jgi:hypothetical protein
MVDGTENGMPGTVPPVATPQNTVDTATFRMLEEVAIGRMIREAGYITAKYCGGGGGKIEPGQAFTKWETIYACRPNTPDKSVFYITRDKNDPDEFNISQYEKYFAEEDRLAVSIIALKIQQELNKKVAFGFDPNRPIPERQIQQMAPAMLPNALPQTNNRAQTEPLRPPNNANTPPGFVTVGTGAPAQVEPIGATPTGAQYAFGTIKRFEQYNADYVCVNGIWVKCSEALLLNKNARLEGNYGFFDLLNITKDGIYKPRDVGRAGIVVNNGLWYLEMPETRPSYWFGPSELLVDGRIIKHFKCYHATDGHCFLSIDGTSFDVTASKENRDEAKKKFYECAEAIRKESSREYRRQKEREKAIEKTGLGLIDLLTGTTKEQKCKRLHPEKFE